METEASVVLELALVTVPGLLRTEDYMSALFNTSRVLRTSSRLENDIAARLHRRLRLTDAEAPLELTAIIDAHGHCRPASRQR